MKLGGCRCHMAHSRCFRLDLRSTSFLRLGHLHCSLQRRLRSEGHPIPSMLRLVWKCALRLLYIGANDEWLGGWGWGELIKILRPRRQRVCRELTWWWWTGRGCKFQSKFFHFSKTWRLGKPMLTLWAEFSFKGCPTSFLCCSKGCGLPASLLWSPWAFCFLHPVLFPFWSSPCSHHLLDCYSSMSLNTYHVRLDLAISTLSAVSKVL